MILLVAFIFAVEAVAPSIGGVFASFGSGNTVEAVLGLLALIGGAFETGRRVLKYLRKIKVRDAFAVAFHIVEDRANSDEVVDGWDKAAAGMRAADEWLLANGFGQLSEAEKARGGLQFEAMHGEQVKVAKVAIAAAEAAQALANGTPEALARPTAP